MKVICFILLCFVSGCLCAYSKHSFVMMSYGNVAPIYDLREGDVFEVPFEDEGKIKHEDYPVLKGWTYKNDTQVHTFISLYSSLGTVVSATSEQLIYASKGCKSPYTLMEIEEVCRGDCLVHYGLNLLGHVTDKRSWNEQGIYMPVLSSDMQQFYVTNDPKKIPVLVSSK